MKFVWLLSLTVLLVNGDISNTCEQNIVTILESDQSTVFQTEQQMVLFPNSECTFTNTLGKSVVYFQPPIDVVFLRYTGASCDPQAILHEDSGMWIDGPSALNGICYVKFTVRNPSSAAQPFSFVKTNMGLNLKATLTAIVFGIILIGWI